MGRGERTLAAWGARMRQDDVLVEVDGLPVR